MMTWLRTLYAACLLAPLLGAACSSSSTASNGEACSVDGDCASGFCYQDPNGASSCQPRPAPAAGGAQCSTNADCVS